MSVSRARNGTRSAAGLGAAALVAAAALATGVAATGASAAGAMTTYLVVYRSGAATNGAAAAVSAAGGHVVANYSPISVVVARSTSIDFAARMKKVDGVEGAVATARFATSVGGGGAADATGTSAAPTATGATTGAVPLGDSLSSKQWDMDQIHVGNAHAVTTGSSSVLVGDIDTGLDYTHPDLAGNVDDRASANCVGGAAVPGMVAAADDNGHGTHTAGTIAARANGIGIVGVAPSVRIAGIKAGNADGFFFPEAVVCSFMWAAEHGVAVTNNSYFADPWLFNCKNDPEQRAIWNAERRAIQYAQKNGVLVVAAEGNQADDLSHPTQDQTSPDNIPVPLTRDITNACAVVPVEVPGVVGVSATGNLRMKSFYSSFGTSTVDVAAPGGDSILQRTAAAPNGRVLSTWPAALLNVTCLPTRRVVDASGATYCYQQGTSMASPHAVGVAALIASRTGLSGSALAAALQRATNPIACPADVQPYAFFPATDGGAPQQCQGGIGHNSWFGSGEVDALKAVS